MKLFNAVENPSQLNRGPMVTIVYAVLIHCATSEFSGRILDAHIYVCIIELIGEVPLPTVQRAPLTRGVPGPSRNRRECVRADSGRYLGWRNARLN